MLTTKTEILEARLSKWRSIRDARARQLAEAEAEFTRATDELNAHIKLVSS